MTHRILSICLLATGLAWARQFGLPYEVPYTDSSGRTLWPGGGIAATSKDSDSLDLWSIGMNGALVNAGAWTSAHGWSPGSPFLPVGSQGPFTPGGGIAAEVRVPNTNMVDTFALGDSGYLWNAGSFDGTNWHGPYQERPWTSIPANKFVKGGGLAVNSRLTTLTDAFTIANDGCLWYAGGWDVSNGFKAPFKWALPGACNFVPGGGIAVNSRTTGMNDTWVIGRDGYLWNAGWFDGQFYPPYQHPNRLPHPFPPGAPVAAVSRDATRVDVYAIDFDGTLWMVGGFVNATPIAPYPIPTSLPRSFQWAKGGSEGRLPLGGVAANARTATLTDVWAIAPDGAAWNAGSWNAAAPFVTNPSSCTHLPAPSHVTLAPPPALPVLAYAQRLGRLTKGPQTNAPAADFAAADLGAAVEASDGQLSFLFGDTRPASRATPLPGEDALGRTTQTTVARNVPPTLTYAASGGMFTPFSVPGIDLGINNTPQDGVSLPGGKEVVFLGTGSNGGPYSNMAVTAETAVPSSPSLSLDHVVNTQYFEYVSSYYEPSDGYVYIFGTGPYFRHSSGVQLARATASCVHDRSSWTYYTGNSKATFETGENNAQPLFTGPHTNLGELSVRKVGSRYIMLYQAGPVGSQQLERGVFARFATSLAGTWSAPLRIWSPNPVGALFAGVGYGSALHQGQGVSVAYDDGLAEPDTSLDPADERKGTYGGEYAPELVARWSRNISGLTFLTYGLSLGNPYQVDLFRSVLTDAGVTPPALPAGPNPESSLVNAGFQGANPLAGWSMDGGPFVAVDQCQGRFLSTYGSLGVNTMGSLQQSFVPGAHSKTLCFSLWGGALIDTPQFVPLEPNVSVRLLHNGVIVRESRPTNNNMNPPACTSSTSGAPVAWDLTEFVGESVTLEVHDSRQDPFGFILVSPFQQGSAISGSGSCRQ